MVQAQVKVMGRGGGGASEGIGKGAAAGGHTGVGAGGGINTYSRVGACFPVPASDVRASGNNVLRVGCQVTPREYTTTPVVASKLV